MDLATSPSVPPGWVWSTMGEIAQIVGGGTPPTGDQRNFENGDIPWITPADLTGYTAKHISSGARCITQLGLTNSGARIMPAGSVLFSSRAPIGYVAIASIPLCTNQGFKSFILGSDIASDYIYYFLKSAKDTATSLASGTTFLEISGAKAATIPVPLAPLPEQHRIVAEIERQFSLLDAGVANLKRVQANLKRYRAAVLQAACTGQLVPTEAELAQAEGRAYEPAAVLLTRILDERRARWEAEQSAKMEAQGKLPLTEAWKAKYQEPAAPDTSGLPELPEGWVWTNMTSLIVEGPQNGIYLPSSAYGSGVPILRIDDYQNDFSRSSDELRKVRATAEEVDRYRLNEQDIVINRVNSMTHIGKCLLIHSRNLPAVFESNMMRLQVASSVKADFCEVYLHSQMGRKRLISNAKWAVNQASINQVDVGITQIPLPPLAEQSRIVAEVERRLSVVDNLEQVVKANLKRAERLRQAILKEAFAGRLVPQDPVDEPASVLLERIKAEREAQAKTLVKKGRGKETPDADHRHNGTSGKAVPSGDARRKRGTADKAPLQPDLFSANGA